MTVFALALVLAGMVMPTEALAYIGPGAGLGAFAVTVALVLGGLLLVVGFLWYPLKRLMKGRKAATPGDGTTGAE